MKSFLSYALILIVALSFTACRQPDGPMPAGSPEVTNRLGDLSRDLLAVARGEQGARQDFADDLKVFVKGRDAENAAGALGLQVAEALQGKKLTEQAAQQLAHDCWVAVAARDISERQIQVLQGDLKAQLGALGVPASNSDSIAGQVPAVQKVVTTRPRRWYEVF